LSSKWARKGVRILSQASIFLFCFIAVFSWPAHLILIHHSGPSARTGSKSDPDQRRSVWCFKLHLPELLHEMVPDRKLRLAGGSARPGFLGPSVSSRPFDSFHGLFVWCRSLSHSWLPSSRSVSLAPFIVPSVLFVDWVLLSGFGSEVCSHLIDIYSTGLCSLAMVAVLLLQSACWQSASSDEHGRDIGLSLPGGSEGHCVCEQEEEVAHTEGKPRQAPLQPLA
jgi:hypothetical protein